MKANDAVMLIEKAQEKYGLRWINTERISSDDWKGKIFEQERTGLQLGIYCREKTYLRLERELAPIQGVTNRVGSKGDWMKLSHFKDGSGYCVDFSDANTLEVILENYFGQKP